MFFTAVSPMIVDQHKEVEYDLTKPRIAVYKNNRKIHQNKVFWCNLRVAQGKDPRVCIEVVVNMKSGEELYSKMYQPPELPHQL